MKFQFLTPTLHGLLDYGAAAGLIVFPFLLGLGGESQLALWFSVAAGLLLIAYSLVTDYAFSLAGLISFDGHLALDVTAGLAFIAMPLVFGFGTLATVYYIAMAAGVLVTVALSKRPTAPVAPGRRDFA